MRLKYLNCLPVVGCATGGYNHLVLISYLKQYKLSEILRIWNSLWLGRWLQFDITFSLQRNQFKFRTNRLFKFKQSNKKKHINALRSRYHWHALHPLASTKTGLPNCGVAESCCSCDSNKGKRKKRGLGVGVRKKKRKRILNAALYPLQVSPISF